MCKGACDPYVGLIARNVLIKRKVLHLINIKSINTQWLNLSHLIVFLKSFFMRKQVMNNQYD